MGQRAFKYRLYPTAPQAVRLTQMLRDHCELYNAALQERREAWAHTSKTSVRYGDQSVQLRAIREGCEDQAMWSFTSQQQTLRRLDKAFQAFFRRVKAGQTPGFPRFRAHTRFNSVDFRHGDGIKYVDVRTGWGDLYVKGAGHVKVRTHRPLPDSAKLGHVSVKREGSGRRAKWFLVLIVDVADIPLEPTGHNVGIDVGVVSYLTTSDGEQVENPRYRAAAARRLAVAQRNLSRKKRGSRRRKKAVEHVAALSATVRRQRLDHVHKTALGLVRAYDLLVLEDLKIKNMTRAPKAKPDLDQPGVFLPNGAAAKAGLNKAILDTGWGMFTQILTAKAASAGRSVILVNPAFTSQMCSKCEHINKANRLTQAAFVCVRCAFECNADTNAAINILRAGTAQHHALTA
jgi:putative transposase